MATISRYTTAAGVRWRVRYRTPDRRQTDKRGFRTKRDAEAFAATIEVKKLTGQFIPEKAGWITVGELAPVFLERKRQSTAPSNFRMIESAWRVHVAPVWSGCRVVDIALIDVESWISAMRANGSGATTVRRAHGVLAGILADAVKSRRLATNPAKGVENLPGRSPRRHIYLSADDVYLLAREAGDHGALVLTLAYCGLRWGEAIALRVRDVQFLKRRLRVLENAVQLGVDHAVGPAKGRKPRDVPVPAFVLDELSKLCQGKPPDALVFPGRDGRYLPRPKSNGGWFVGAVKRAAIQSVTPHDLRHTCASLAVSAGVNVLALQRMLGHRSAKVTLDTYADLFDDDLDAVAVTLHARYSREIVGKKWAETASATEEVRRKSPPSA